MKFFIVLLLLLSVNSVMAKEIKNYDQANFSQATKAEQVTLLHFHADWCPVCRRQDDALLEISKNKEFSHLTILKADYDKENDLKKRFNVKGQSTLIVLVGDHEVARSQGIYNKAEIEKMFFKFIK